MKIYFVKTAAWTLLTCTTLFFTACSKDSININIGENGTEEGQSDNGTGTPDQKALITFHASIESRNMTRSLSPMRKGITSSIYAFKSPVTSLETPSAEGVYTTATVGVLTGVEGYKMYLPNGVYYFYAISNNSSTASAKFINERSEPLTNGVDYLWASNKLQDVTSTQVSMPILFQHCATQIVFNISAGSGIKLDKLVSASITPATPGATMDMITGEITPSTTYSTETANMGINGFTAQYIMLPLKTNTAMPLTLQILADGENTPRTYNVNVLLPNGELAGGDSYVFSAVIDGNSVSFPNVEVLGWTEVDETGKPLYPSQKPD